MKNGLLDKPIGPPDRITIHGLNEPVLHPRVAVLKIRCTCPPSSGMSCFRDNDPEIDPKCPVHDKNKKNRE